MPVISTFCLAGTRNTVQATSEHSWARKRGSDVVDKSHRSTTDIISAVCTIDVTWALVWMFGRKWAVNIAAPSFGSLQQKRRFLQQKFRFDSSNHVNSIQRRHKVIRLSLTFFSLSIHLLIACVEDPVRSLSAKRHSFTSVSVAMVDRVSKRLKMKMWH